MTDQILLPLNRGSNLSWPLTLKDSAGVAIPVTGWTYTIVESVPVALGATAACTVTDGPNGVATLSCPWSATWPDGKGPKASFRIKASGFSDAFPEILVDLQ